jgi:hypothetical protein
MWDCSSFPIDENIRRVASFVERQRGKVWVEGAVNEVIHTGNSTPRGNLTDPDLAERYLRETGAFLVVPNLGTEPLATTAIAHYDGPLARAICRRIGPRIVLHGSSSLRDEDLARLPGDGIVKINVWTIFERLGGQAIARDILPNLGNLFTAEQLEAWQNGGYLGPRFTSPAYIAEQCKGRLGPKSWALVEHHRREIWMDVVAARMMFYLDQFGYGQWKG